MTARLDHLNIEDADVNVDVDADADTAMQMRSDWLHTRSDLEKPASVSRKKRPEVSLCGWRGYKPSMGKHTFHEGQTVPYP